MSQDNTSNHARAPISAAFVKAMREEFGELKVNYVNENGLVLGDRDPGPWASITLPRKTQ